MTSVVVDETWGYRRLDPLPDPDELADFYESGYYDLLRSGRRAPDLARLQEGGPEAERERDWMRQTLHADMIAWATAHHGETGTLLEVGCGPGDMLESFLAAGWSAIGLEPAEEVAAACQARGLDVRPQVLESFADAAHDQPDAILMRLVLEHVRDPAGLLQTAHRTLAPGGIVIVETPNDFNPMQESARQTHDLDEWWVVAPDHLNYFDFDSLSALLDATGFDVLDRSTSFPMEMFLLMGDNYVGNPDVGSQCHSRRRNLELNLDTEARRTLYGGMASAGLGRTCQLVARAR